MKKKILWITSTFPLKTGDVEVPWMVELVSRLRKYYDIEILAPRYKGRGDTQVHGIPVHRLGYAPMPFEILTYGSGMPSKIKNPVLWPWFLTYILLSRRKVKQLLKRKKYDIIYVNWPLPHIFMVPPTTIPIISKFYTAGLVFGKKLPILLDFILNKSTYVIFNSIFTMGFLFKGNIVVFIKRKFNFDTIYDLPKIKPIKRIEHQGFNILFVGRIIERKGVNYLIDAFLKIKDEDVNLDIVGTGKLDFPTMDLFNFHGRVSESKLKELYSKADVVVLPAIIDKKGDTEGLGVVLIEAMSSGIPVIGTDVGGIPELIIPNKTGLLIEQKNIIALKEAILKIKNDKGLRDRLSKQGKEHIKKNFNWNVVIKKYKKVFNSV